VPRPRQTTTGLLAAAGLLLTVAVFLLDLVLPSPIATGILYAGVLVLAARALSSRTIFGAAALMSLLCLLALPGAFRADAALDAIAVVNTGLEIAAIWGAVLLLRTRAHAGGGGGGATGAPQGRLEESAPARASGTERDLRDQLERKNEELQMFAHIASHDLREPLRMISSYTQLLAERYRGRLDGDADDFIHYAVDGVHRMENLLDALLDYVRVGSRAKSFEDVDTQEVLEDVERNLLVVIEESGAVIEADALPRVRADPAQVAQLLQNLLANAIKFRGGERPLVQVSATRDGDRWRFRVRDNGIGIDREQQERVFGIFERLHTSDEYPGTGIGLSICKRIVQRHGGRIWVESEPGRGSDFCFTLPAVPGDTATWHRRARTPTCRPRLRPLASDARAAGLRYGATSHSYEPEVRTMHRAILCLAALCTLLCGCGPKTPPADSSNDAGANAAATSANAATNAGADTGAAASGEWSGFVDRFVAKYFEFNPHVAVSAGLHQYDGKLPDLGPEAVAGQLAWLQKERDRMAAWDLSAAGEAARFERDYLLSAADRLRFQLAISEFLYTNPTLYSGVMGPDVYLTREYAPLPERMRAFIEYEKSLPAFLSTMRSNLRSPLARPRLETARGIFDGYVTFFQDTVPGIFAGVEDEALQAALASSNATALGALRETRDWVAAQLENASNDYALGADRFLEMLRLSEGVEITLDELRAAGTQDLQRNLEALRAACAQYAPGETVAACAEKSQLRKPAEGPVAGARRQLPMLRQFLIDEGIVTIPSDEVALVDEAPPYRRFNAAYIQVPGPYERGLPSIYYIAPPDPSWSEEDQRAYIPAEMDLLFISAHEVWPGHFLQNLYSNRTKIGNIFGHTTYSEGWAHYCEEMMWDAGLGRGDPETHIGQLLNALLRNVRFMSAIGLHTEGMTVEQSVQMFETQAYQDHGNALQQARRGTFDPGYLNYTLGKLMIVKLRDDWTAGRGGKNAWKEFHDRLLSYGEPPLPLVRRYMLGADYGGDTRLLP
jgi:signal transduction histidine kinase